MVDPGVVLRRTICEHCERLTINDDEFVVDNAYGTNEKCSNWLENCSTTDNESTCVSETSDSCSSISTGTSSSTNEDIVVKNTVIRKYDDIDESDLSALIATKNSYRNVSIAKSRNVHLGNVMYINGPLYINQSATVINQQTTINQVLVDKSVPQPRILNRKSWLAQPPMAEQIRMEGPAKYVIICHTATEEAYTEPDNILHVRLIQQFHIESRKWDDIGYNFLIGADGNVYEGRGWGVVGAHSYGYNDVSLGIAFIGCYMKKLPSQAALLGAKRLLTYGVGIGAITADYSLLGHCQISTTESPGSTLYEEIKTWSHYNSAFNISLPS